VELRQLERQWDDYKVTHLNHRRLIRTAADEHGAVYKCLLEYPSLNPEPTHHQIQNAPITQFKTDPSPAP